MKQLLSEEFIDFKLLTPKQREEVEHSREVREAAFNNVLSAKQNELLEREDELMECMAKAAGFDGYETGTCNYKDVYHKILRQPDAVDDAIKYIYRKFEQMKWNGSTGEEYMQLREDGKALGEFEAGQHVWLKQQYLNDVLTAIRPKAEKYKFGDGARFPSAREFKGLTPEQMDSIRRPEAVVVQDSQGADVSLDASIAGRVRTLWEAGIVTGASCSGMVQDHPYHRHQDDDRAGRWKKGDLEYVFPATSHAYISFPVDDNHPDMIARTQDLAESWGWVVDRQAIYGKDSIVLRPPHTLDGTGYTQISREIENEIEGIMAQYGLTDVAEARDDARKEVEFRHGGRIMYTDRMLAYRWRKLTEGLGDIMYQIERDTLKKNIEEGRAVKVYDYDARFVTMNADQLSEVFRRSGIVLDKDSIPTEGLKGVGDEIWHMPRFLVSGGEARLMGKDEPLPGRGLLESRENLSRILASQIKGTVHTSEPKPYDYRLTVMIHPDPQTAEQAERFTFTCALGSTEYYRMAGDNYDMTYLLAAKFKDELYRAAIDAYDNGFSKKVDDAARHQKVSDIRIRSGMDGHTYISCHVFGQRQLAKRMTPGDAEYYRMRMASSDKAYNRVAPELALKYYKAEIEQAGQERTRSNGMSR